MTYGLHLWFKKRWHRTVTLSNEIELSESATPVIGSITLDKLTSLGFIPMSLKCGIIHWINIEKIKGGNTFYYFIGYMAFIQQLFLKC